MSIARRTTEAPIYDSSQRRARVLEELTALFQFRDLLAQLVARNIKTRYKRSVLGVAWTMLNPLLTMAVLAIVFSNLFRLTLPFFPVYVLSGLVVWSFFSQTTTSIMHELIWGGSLIHRIYVPKTVFAGSALGTGLVNIAIALVPLALIMIVSGAPLSPALLFLPVPLALLALYTLGVGLLLSILAIRFGDVVDMYQILLMAWMYLTPIMYPPEIIPDHLQWVLAVNPVYYMLQAFRAPILHGTLPDASLLGACVAIALVFGSVGLWVFASNADDIAYHV